MARRSFFNLFATRSKSLVPSSIFCLFPPLPNGPLKHLRQQSRARVSGLANGRDLHQFDSLWSCPGHQITDAARQRIAIALATYPAASVEKVTKGMSRLLAGAYPGSSISIYPNYTTIV